MFDFLTLLIVIAIVVLVIIVVMMTKENILETVRRRDTHLSHRIRDEIAAAVAMEEDRARNAENSAVYNADADLRRAVRKLEAVIATTAAGNSYELKAAVTALMALIQANAGTAGTNNDATNNRITTMESYLLTLIADAAAGQAPETRFRTRLWTMTDASNQQITAYSFYLCSPNITPIPDFSLLTFDRKGRPTPFGPWVMVQTWLQFSPPI